MFGKSKHKFYMSKFKHISLNSYFRYRREWVFKVDDYAGRTNNSITKEIHENAIVAVMIRP